MLGFISSLPATLKGHYGPLTCGISYNAKKLQGPQGPLAFWTQMVNGPGGVAWPLCACANAATDSHDSLISPMVPISLDVSEWVQHHCVVGAVLASVCGARGGSGFRNLAGGWAWTDGWGYTVGFSQEAVEELYT